MMSLGASGVQDTYTLSNGLHDQESGRRIRKVHYQEHSGRVLPRLRNDGR